MNIYFQSDETQKVKQKGSIFIIKKVSKELLREFANSQKLTSITEINMLGKSCIFKTQARSFTN